MDSGAFLQFHLRVGARVGLRLLAPLLAGLFAAYYFLRPEFFLLLGDHLFSRAPYLGRGLIISLITLAAASLLAPRVTFGLGGWIRHLPASSALQRRLSAFAVLIAQAPLLLVLAGLGFFSIGKNGWPEALSAAAGIASAGYASSLLALAVRRPAWAYAAGLAGGILCGSGNLGLWLGGVLVAVLSDRAPGPFLGRSAPLRRRPLAASPSRFFLALAWRSIGPRIFLAYLAPAVILGAFSLFLRNNPLPRHAADAAVRLAGLLALGASLAGGASLMAKRRPLWAWGRSLPLSSYRRVAIDAAFLSFLALPLLVPAAAMRLSTLPATVAVLPYFALRAAAASRPSMETPRSPVPAFFLESALFAALTSLWPWASVLALMASPAALRIAAGRDRAVKAGRWLELRFSAPGDSQAWSSR